MIDRWEAIADVAIVAAEAEPVSFEEFVEGLRDIKIAIDQRLQLAKAELDARESADDNDF